MEDLPHVLNVLSICRVALLRFLVNAEAFLNLVQQAMDTRKHCLID